MRASLGNRITATGRFIDRLRRSRKGGVAMIYALTLPFVSVAAVTGVDIHRATSVRMSLQDALDAATLAAARSDATTTSGIRSIGMTALRANLAPFPDGVYLDESAAETSFVLNADGSVTSEALATVDTLVAGAFIGDEFTVNVESMVFRSNNRVEVALVIDNTGSMADQGRIGAARTAADSLVRRLEAAAARSVEADAVRISLVPFSQTVRVLPGFTARNSSTQAQSHAWLSRATNHTGNALFSTGQNRFAVYDTLRTGWGGCVESRPYPYDVRDTAPSTSVQASLFVPYFAPDDPDRNDLSDSTWRGWFDNGWTNSNDYMNDVEGSQSGNLSSSARTTQWNNRLRNANKYAFNRILSGVTLNTSKGPNRGCNLQPVMRLTDDFDGLRDSIADMEPSGNTNIPMGLMWGWHTLSPRAPFADGRPYSEERLTKIIILLTDGDNVNSDSYVPDESIYSGLGLIWQNRLDRPGTTIGLGSSATQRRNAMDDRLEELCDNLRDNEIMLYTVGVQVSTRTQTLLRECATDDDMFYNVSNTAGIEAAFDRIAGSIENLRIAR